MRLFYLINAVLVIGALWIVIVRSLGKGSGNPDFQIVRYGMLCFAALALWQNIAGILAPPFKVEPYGIAIMLGCLGFVAARRTLHRDMELGEIQKELELARRIQLSLLPADFLASMRFCVAARYVPMTSVAGDLYDYLVAGKNYAGLLIADVSGHGVPAALIASMVKMAASAQRTHAAHPAQVLAGMNAALCGNTQGQFVTAAYVYLDAQAARLRYAAAGHPAMLMLRGGNITEVAENGLLLAASEQSDYGELTLPIEPGDRLLLYTDGLTEARNVRAELFGEQALMAAFLSTADLTPDQAADTIIAKVKHWAPTQDDDLTALICDFLS
jgi:sigma-B regulation protein RsbU (phosphoserine phosphatase)